MFARIMGTREFTGWHMAGVMFLFFGTIISVNLVMAYFATSSWSGLVVKNSYVESQRFNGVTAERQAMLDMGWKEFKVAVEYDGDQHRTDRRRYVWDQRRSRMVARLGWDAVRVIKEDPPAEVIARVEESLRARGWRGEIANPQPRTRRLSA